MDALRNMEVLLSPCTEMMDAAYKFEFQIVKEGAGARKPDTECNYFGNAERDLKICSPESDRTFMAGSLRYMAPEIISLEPFRKPLTLELPLKIDVYSFGRLAFEVLTGEDPFKSFNLRKKIPSRPWSGEETDAVLHLMTEAVDKGPGIWDYVSGNLFERYGFDRASDSCKQQWHTQLQNYRDILEHESKTRRKSFWDITEYERSKKKLPRTFNFEWCEMIEKMALVVDDIDAECELDEGFSDESAAARTDDHSYISQCDEVVESNAGRKRSFDDEDHDLLMTNIATLVNQRVEDALKPRPKIQKLDK